MVRVLELCELADAYPQHHVVVVYFHTQDMRMWEQFEAFLLGKFRGYA